MEGNGTENGEGRQMERRKGTCQLSKGVELLHGSTMGGRRGSWVPKGDRSKNGFTDQKMKLWGGGVAGSAKLKRGSAGESGRKVRGKK